MKVPIIRKSHLWLIHGGTSSSRAYAYASGFGPLPCGMPFYTPMELERALAFAKVNPIPPGMQIEGGTRWPDFLFHGGGRPSFFVSEKVVESIQRISAPIHRLTEMPVGSFATRVSRRSPPPRYFVVETVPGIEVDIAASGFVIDEQGIPRQPFSTSPSPLKFRGSSWNGSDLFDYHPFQRREVRHTNMYCSSALMELAKKENWTSIDFTNVALV